MIKKVAAAALIALTLQTSLPKRSEAAIALGVGLGLAPVTATIAVAVTAGVAGAGLATTGMVTGLMAIIQTSLHGSSKYTGVSIATLILGLVLLDEASDAPLQFQPIDSKKAEQLGISQAERVSFNSELEEINAIHQTITRKIVELEAPTYGQSHALWVRYGKSLAPESFSALQKVADELARVAAN